MGFIGNGRNRALPIVSFLGFHGEHHKGVECHVLEGKLTHCRPRQTLNHEHVGLHQPQPNTGLQIAQSNRSPQQLEQQDRKKEQVTNPTAATHCKLGYLG